MYSGRNEPRLVEDIQLRQDRLNFI